MSYALLGMGLALSFMVMALYFQRLILHHLPNAEVSLSLSQGCVNRVSLDPGCIAVSCRPSIEVAKHVAVASLDTHDCILSI